MCKTVEVVGPNLLVDLDYKFCKLYFDSVFCAHQHFIIVHLVF